MKLSTKTKRGSGRASRTVRAVRESDGRLRLLERVDLDAGAVVTVMVDDKRSRHPVMLPLRKLGVPKTALTREQLYGDLHDE
jgi:hypothetical protein